MRTTDSIPNFKKFLSLHKIDEGPEGAEAKQLGGLGGAVLFTLMTMVIDYI